MSISSLPNELLLMIADNLDEHELNALLRASHHFHALFNPYLYKLTFRKSGNKTLYWACCNGIDEVAKKMLALGVDPEAPCMPKWVHVWPFDTPLICAIQCGKPSVVKVLLDTERVNVDMQGRVSPLDIATREGRDVIVKMLLENKAQVNQLVPRTRSPLHTAVYNKNNGTSTIKMLLDNKADPNSVDEDGNTPLHLAKDLETVELLLYYGADVNTANRLDQTPLYNAVRAKNNKWLQRLLEAGADVNKQNRRGETPLFFIGSRNDPNRPASGKDTDTDADIVRTLLSKGADICHLDRDLSTALHAICYDGDAETIQLLLSFGASASCKNRKGLTPLHIAAEEGWPDLIRLLLTHGANVNATNYYRSSPLHRMTSIPKRKLRAPGNQERYNTAMEVLLAAGANVNAVDRIGQTPLMKAVYHAYWRFVRILLDANGVDVTIKDKRGKTASRLSKDGGIESDRLRRQTLEAMKDKTEAQSLAGGQDVAAAGGGGGGLAVD